MKDEKVIQKRFSELQEMTVAVTKSQDKDAVNHEKFHQWSTSVLSLLKSVFGENSPHYKNFLTLYESFPGYVWNFQKPLGVFQAAKEDYEAGYIFTIRGLIKAEDSIDIMDQATDLLNAKFKDPACILAGVALEIALKELCSQNNIPLGKLDTMNVELCKKSVYNMGMQKQITTWAHWRNKAAHGEFSEYKETDVEDMIKGVTRFIGDYL